MTATKDLNERTRAERTRATLTQLRRELLAQRGAAGHWTGQLSASALSTATAISAISAMSVSPVAAGNDRQSVDASEFVESGIAYLRREQNEDGGFGDTDRSYSNIATSFLVLAASTLATMAFQIGLDSAQLDRLREYIRGAGGLDGLRRRYGTDKTFVVPIMTNLAIAGLVDWNDVPQLPFEAAVVPQSMYRAMRMPVVSYAIPALVAIGQTRHFHGRKAVWPVRTIRAAAIPRTLHVLEQMQPESGGYLEATPLTAFVVMSLAATKRQSHPVAQRGMQFLKNSVSADGSWPIDTNLAAWVTSLAILALRCDDQDDALWCDEALVKWYLGCQHTRRHPFTGASPGGWGWTDLSGAVPDGDDTPAAILALLQMRRSGVQHPDLIAAVQLAAQWLLSLQNRDGGWPTFCRGWGKLPFDRSSTDLTAHAIRALRAVASDTSPPSALVKACAQAVARGEKFLLRKQLPSGEWTPLWFGNQDEPDDVNPVYGTARVLLSVDASARDRVPLIRAYGRACQALLNRQNADGGWGGGVSVRQWYEREEIDVADQPPLTSTMEETAVAVEALAHLWKLWQGVPDLFSRIGATGLSDVTRSAIIAGVEFLLRGVADGRHRQPWPIGFYFAKLWYHEQLYASVFTVAALGKFLSGVDDRYKQLHK